VAASVLDFLSVMGVVLVVALLWVRILERHRNERDK